MADNFGVAEAQLAGTALAKEIKTSTITLAEKEALLAFIKRLVEMPQMVKERDKIDEVIERKRNEMVNIEAATKEAKRNADIRKNEINEQVRNQESYLSEVRLNCIDEKALAIRKMDDEISAHEVGVLAQKRELDEDIARKTTRSNALDNEISSLETKLAVFKGKIADL